MTQKFCTGDQVRYVSRALWCGDFGEIHIIHKCSYRGNGLFNYSTDRGAWFTEDDFELICRANKTTFKLLDKALKEENTCSLGM